VEAPDKSDIMGFAGPRGDAIAAP